MAGLLDFQNPDSLAQLGLIGGLLTATKGSNWPLMLHQAAQAQERRKLMQADEQQRLAQAEQMKRQQAEQEKAGHRGIIGEWGRVLEGGI